MAADDSLLALLAFGDGGYGRMFASAFALTAGVAAASFCTGALLGVVGALGKLSRHASLAWLARLYTTLVRALPELLCLLLAFYVVAPAVERALRDSGIVSDGFAFDPFVVAALSLGFIQGAYLTDIFRAALVNVPVGQVEAAHAYGMTPWQTLTRIRLPAAARLALPGVGNVWLNATKDASFISVLGSFTDLLRASQLAAGATRHYVFFYLVTAALFLLLSIASTGVFAALERHANRGTRRATA
ncbi:ABC transporter permease subunit [Burkholderia vietnamiensis]|jgi:His/Glu/Gln/Arg/opine family amino acid ABC transporter permease subunit|uniref:ABC transporter permease n=1 Tax=Burkholderia vietnamiensis TaxID=60552 RepID=UPI00075D2DEC|nr:ABC transporter permease subunit [Burkholderia vietnamiensis]KVF37456.1 amino acid ABC transporter permease [Burkholderia vietnamiensis]MBR8281659.1 ABC transporter permease subunit [Burkholderia vietnamiensis]MCA8194326.1 ABC transporter permease subunit [Burkholderia vietnamiensis]MDN7409957.1 ABC transporter permease subunit [Burkholderia vietnamiensis]QTK86278.1 ABC transporter permease subunit [Burkholderia vietnamiensis]